MRYIGYIYIYDMCIYIYTFLQYPVGPAIPHSAHSGLCHLLRQPQGPAPSPAQGTQRCMVSHGIQAELPRAQLRQEAQRLSLRKPS